jgi:uncharacterized protein
MNLMKKIFLFLLFLFSIQLSAQNQTEIPELKRPVMDLVGILKPEEVSIIENKILNLQKEKGSQIAVLIIPSTGDLPIEDYSIRVAEKWKLGRKGIDDGVLFLIAYNDRKMRIEVGYGLEGAIPDAKAKQILDDFVRPHFKNKNFYKGIDTGVDLLIKLIKNESLPEPAKKNDKSNLLDKSLDIITSLIAYLIICSFPLLVHLGILATSYEHSKIYGTIMTILYILTPIILFYYFIPFSLLSVIITTYAALIPFGIIDYMINPPPKKKVEPNENSKLSNSSKSSTTSRTSGWLSSSNWSSSSFGGFSGGGGSFGGGGSSSSW